LQQCKRDSEDEGDRHHLKWSYEDVRSQKNDKDVAEEVGKSPHRKDDYH